MAVQEDAFKIPESAPVNCQNTPENIPKDKQATTEQSHPPLLTPNFKSVEQTQPQENLVNESSSTPSKKKRSLKAQTKKQGKKR